MDWIEKTISWVEKFAAFASVFCVVLMMLNVTADVVGRYIIGRPVPGTITIVSSYYMVALTFIPLIVAERRNAHVAVDVLFASFPSWLQRPLYSLNYLLITAILVVLTMRSTEMALQKTGTGAVVEQGTILIPIWQSYWLVPIGCSLMALVAVCRFVCGVIGAEIRTSPQEVFDE